MTSKLIGHMRIREALIRSGKQDELSHCLLFLGRESIGKRQVAIWLAKKYIEEDWETTGGWVEDYEHADLHKISPDGNSLKKGQIQELLPELGKKPFQARGRVVIVDDFHKATVEAQNSFLKTLEEPEPHTLLILTAPDTQQILPTVLSRSRIVHFDAPTEEELLPELRERSSLEDDELKSLIRIRQGAVGNILQDLTGEEADYRKPLLKWLRNLHKNRRGQSYQVAEQMAKTKEDATRILGEISLWFRDMLWVTNEENPQRLVYQNEQRHLKAQSDYLKPWHYDKIQREIEKANTELTYNVNQTLVWENLLFNIQEAFYDNRNRSKI